jgi:hypothetical protein
VWAEVWVEQGKLRGRKQGTRKRGGMNRGKPAAHSLKRHVPMMSSTCPSPSRPTLCVRRWSAASPGMRVVPKTCRETKRGARVSRSGYGWGGGGLAVQPA